MELKLNKVVREWSYRLDTGIPDAKNYDHIKVLGKVLEDFKYPKQFVNEYIKKLLKEADVVGSTLAQARSIATKGQTYTSKLSNKVYTKGKESEGPKTVSEPKKEPEAPKKPKISAPEKSPEVKSEKDRSIKPVSPEQYKATFETQIDISDDDYSKSTTDYKGSDISVQSPPDPFKMPDAINKLAETGKFPRKYAKVLERMMNTKLARKASSGGFEPPWSHFSGEPGGAGRTTSQAGELMAMVGTAMNDEQFEEFASSMENHLNKIREEKGPFTAKEWDKYSRDLIIQKDWIQAARNNRKAIKNQMQGLFPEGTEIVNTSWDTTKEVEAMGMDYDSKGFSTDMFVKVKLPDGTEQMHEVSLKKDKNVNFLNSGAGSFSDWKKPLPKEIDQKEYAKGQRQRLLNVIDTLGMDTIKSAAELDTPEGEELRKVLDSKKMSLDDIGDVSNKNKKKATLFALNALAKSGNEEAQKLYDEHISANRKFQKDSIDAIAKDPEMKEGMINQIKTEFPLKSVAAGEETMAIGDMSLDKNTMTDIFGTNDFDEIKEKLVPGVDKKGNPFLGYRAEIDGEILPISNVKIREAGVGYLGSFKFDMELHPEFAKRLKKSNEDVYGE